MKKTCCVKFLLITFFLMLFVRRNAFSFDAILSSNSAYLSTQKNIVQQGVRLKSNFFDLNGNFIFGGENKIKTAGLIILPHGFVSVGLGQLALSGFINRLKSQTLSRQSLFHSHTTAVSDFSYKLSSITASINTPYSFILDFELQRVRFFAGTSISKNQESFSNEIGLKMPVYVGFEVSLFDSHKKKNTSREKTRANLMFVGGRFYNDNSNTEKSWFLQKEFFLSGAYHYFLGEFDFSSPLLSVFSSALISENPFKKISFFTRNELSLRLDFFRFHTKVFYGDVNYLSSEGKILRQPFEIYVNPQFVFNFYSIIPFTIRFSFATQFEKSVPSGITAKEENTLDIKSGVSFNTKTFFISGDWGIVGAQYTNRIFFENKTNFYFLGEFSWKPKWKKLQQEFSISAQYAESIAQRKDSQKVTVNVKGVYRPLNLFKTELQTSFVIDNVPSEIFSVQAKSFFNIKTKLVNTLLNSKFICEKTSRKADIKMSWGIGATLEFDVLNALSKGKRKSKL
ncbi:MAG: hypothetical protein ACRC4W_03930 [Treponemataceae bacterium]